MIQHYYLPNGIFIENGHIYSCIYDLNSCKLYKINRTLADFINNITSINFSETLNNNETRMISYLLTNNLLSTEPTVKNDICIYSPNIKFAWIEVTNNCNLQCIHCYENSSIHCHNEMTIDNFKRTVEQLYSFKIKKIQIIGGEPLVLKNKLKDMLDIARPMFESVEVFTNGTLIDHDWVKYFKYMNIKVALSVYSYCSKEHDKVTRSEGSFRKTNDAILMLKEHGVAYRVANIIMNGISLCEKNTDLYDLDSCKDIVRLSGRANLKLLNRDLIRKSLITEKDFNYKLKKSLVISLKNGHNCFSHKLYISSDLKVYPCVMERRICHGSIAEKSLSEILKSEILHFNKDHVTGCKDCEYKYACFDCRPNAISSNIYEKPWNCTYDPYSGIWENTETFIDKLINVNECERG